MTADAQIASVRSVAIREVTTVQIDLSKASGTPADGLDIGQSKIVGGIHA